jgi:5'-nucleotidase
VLYLKGNHTFRADIKPTGVIDMDGVVVNFVPAICNEHNRITGKHLTPADITSWDMRQFGVTDEMWIKPGFFRKLRPIPGAIEVLYKHKDNYNFVIATDCMSIDFIQKEKQLWLEEHLSFIKQAYFLSDKSIVPGDFILDDAPHHLDNYPGIRIKMITPYNKNTKADYEVEDWEAIDNLFSKGF